MAIRNMEEPSVRKRSALDATSQSLVSATVYLLPDKLKLIQQICADKNRRISDLISDAIDEYLANAASS
jgi:hypothetical protein